MQEREKKTNYSLTDEPLLYLLSSPSYCPSLPGTNAMPLRPYVHG